MDEQGVSSVWSGGYPFISKARIIIRVITVASCIL